ncbi:MAG TPA: hypothetical protein EYO33_05785 [Phycisphaerales bacterium]|nr:hypothetical protein [Phycisphaerales bacterium]
MKSERLVRRVEQIHLGDDRYLDARAIEMEWFGGGADEAEEDFEDFDEMETLAILRFDVDTAEYAQLAKLGMVDSVPGGDDETDRSCRVSFRTDSDLLDDAEETLREEWEASLEESDEEPTIWNDLDYWELLSID